MTDRPDSLAIDMFLADRAEAINGKLYVMGGAWDRLQVPELPGPLPVPISVAVVITVPWSLTNKEFTFSLELVDVDNNPVALPLEEGEDAGLFSIPFEVGRPPGLREGRPVTIDLINETDTPEQLHWHGQIVPADVDGSAEEGTPFIPAHGTRRHHPAPTPTRCAFDPTP